MRFAKYLQDKGFFQIFSCSLAGENVYKLPTYGTDRGGHEGRHLFNELTCEPICPRSSGDEGLSDG